MLRLKTLAARLEGIRTTEALSGPKGSKKAVGAFVTLDLAITNRTAAPASVADDQFVLLLRDIYGADPEVEDGYEPRSFLRQAREIPPNGTERGTVTFAVPRDEIKELKEVGDLDVGNFGGGGGAEDFEPEAIFDEPEYGVIRTYK